jgi:hypothetical protein
MEQMVRVVVKFMEDNPQNLHHEFQYIALAAFTQAWPCRK